MLPSPRASAWQASISRSRAEGDGLDRPVATRYTYSGLSPALRATAALRCRALTAASWRRRFSVRDSIMSVVRVVDCVSITYSIAMMYRQSTYRRRRRRSGITGGTVAAAITAALAGTATVVAVAVHLSTGAQEEPPVEVRNSPAAHEAEAETDMSDDQDMSQYEADESRRRRDQQAPQFFGTPLWED